MLLFGTGGKYEGEFKDGKFNGFGILNYKNTDKYMGTWLEGKCSGKG